MANHIFSARLESRGVPAEALSPILKESEDAGWEAGVEYIDDLGSTLTFDIRAASVTDLAAVLQDIADTIGKAESALK